VATPFDVTLKELVRDFLPDYEQQFDLSEFAPLRPLNVDLTTMSAATDVTLAHGDPPEEIVDINFQAGPDAKVPSRVLMYNGILHHRYQVPVHSILVLLRPEANLAAITGKVRYQTRRRKGIIELRLRGVTPVAAAGPAVPDRRAGDAPAGAPLPAAGTGAAAGATGLGGYRDCGAAAAGGQSGGS
jgi:hypothetical protein